uniref:Movement protein TGBp3 n=1 Tax=Pepino mosaic virus TaxID=112229 RepID=Q699Z6_9VIRU|nr:triple gene block 3 protein [Pepino mosaic virus]ACO59308.1 triple gene block protein 3 [Pepino mosaic virus]ACO59347.1 triple gene block protein 3 [Pepino mosaic virus]ACO59378.1 triple gene block protein 3 [Pepino mosaic virus]AFZ88256.1 triple gene block protein 3 [Pepino mosaic virus]
MSSYSSSFLHWVLSSPINLVLALAVILTSIIATTHILQPKQVNQCQVIIDGAAIVITNCPNTPEVLKAINFSPWNGLSFPQL